MTVILLLLLLAALLFSLRLPLPAAAGLTALLLGLATVVLAAPHGAGGAVPPTTPPPMLPPGATPPSQPAGEVLARGKVAACWLRVEVAAVERPGGVVLVYRAYRPNPCYQLAPVRATVQGSASSSAVTVILEFTGSPPPKGAYCVQVVPPPLTGEVELPGKPETVVVRLVLNEYQQEGAQGARVCSGETVLRLR